jgi:hypothetical protein
MVKEEGEEDLEALDAQKAQAFAGRFTQQVCNHF